MSFPQNPFPVFGKIIDRGSGIVVTMLNLRTNESDTAITDTDGSFVLDPSNTDNGYEEGDILRISAMSSTRFIKVDTQLNPGGVNADLIDTLITYNKSIISRKGLTVPHGISLGKTKTKRR